MDAAEYLHMKYMHDQPMSGSGMAPTINIGTPSVSGNLAPPAPPVPPPVVLPPAPPPPAPISIFYLIFYTALFTISVRHLRK